jgi:hypothetical protein
VVSNMAFIFHHILGIMGYNGVFNGVSNGI